MNIRLLFLVLLLPLLCFAQNTFQPGYYIENDGTRKEGLIYNIGWKDSPVDFDFKTLEHDKVQKKSIKEVQEFGIDGYEFRRFSVEIERSGTILSNLDESREPQWKKETLFLRSIVKGKANLYQYEDGNIIKYFFSTGDHSTAIQLVYKEYSHDGKVAHNNMFRGQLYDIMKEDQKKSDYYKSINYTYRELRKRFVEYNGLSSEESGKVAGNHNRFSFDIKVTAGLSLAKLSLTPRGEVPAVTNIDFDSKITPSVGIEAEFILPFNNNKWSVFAQPNYIQYKDNGSSEDDGFTQKWETEYKQLEIPLGIRHYLYLSEDSRIFINAAYVAGISLGSSYIEFENYLPSGTVNYRIPADIVHSSGFAVGTGFAHGKWSAEARCNFSRSVLKNSAYWTGKYSSVGIILGYKIL